MPEGWGRVLICAATRGELEVCAPGLGEEVLSAGRERGAFRFAVTGVGIPMTLLRLPALIAGGKPDLIVNLGIAGAYPGSGLAIGELVIGRSETFGDMGLELPGPEAFQPLSGLPWADAEYREPIPLAAEPLLEHPPQPLRLGHGCTVNACTGRAATGELRRRLFRADFESMEGAAVALAGKHAGIPVCEVRAVSNFAADRDMRPDNVTLALRNLGVYMAAWIAGRA